VPTSIDLIPLPPNRPDPSIHFPSPGGKPSSEQPHVAGSNKWKVASVSQSRNQVKHQQICGTADL